MTNQAKLASLMLLLALAGCTATPTPFPESPTAPTTMASAWRCSDFLRHGKSAIVVPPSITETGCTADNGQLAVPGTLSCANGTKLVFVDHWAVTEKVVVDLRTTPEATLRKSCLGS